MKTIRKLHLWLGVLFAPTIFFFAFSGGLQILGLHEGSGSSAWIAKLALIHKDQRIAEAERPARPPADAAPAHEEPKVPRPAPPPRSTVLVVFFLLMALGLMASTGLGVYMAFAFKRDRRTIIALLVAGVALPILGLVL